jgi:toluene monooxygenase system protein E
MPSEYEIVTQKLHYHFRKSPAPFEQDPGTPVNQWYLAHREGSPLQVDDWEEFRDPHQLTYRRYIELQNERETYVDGLIDRFEADDHDAGLDPGWVKVLERLYLPSRFPGHVLQMVALYVAQMAPTSFVTNPAELQAADEMRRIQRLAYRAKSLSLAHYAELASSDSTRSLWQDDPAWQPLREACEQLLVIYDWGNAFAALNLALKPAFDELFCVQLSRLAERNGDGMMALVLDDLALDARRSREWTQTLAEFAVDRRPENRELLRAWVDEWTPRTQRAIGALAGLFADAPSPLEPEVVTDDVVRAQREFLSGCGLG